MHCRTDHCQLGLPASRAMGRDGDWAAFGSNGNSWEPVNPMWVTAHILDLKDPDLPNDWSMPGALFFVATVVTTIGYGSFAPVTTPNRSPPLKKWNDGTSRTPWLAISCLVSSELSPITWSNKATVR